MQTTQRNPRELALIIVLIVGAVGYASWSLTRDKATADAIATKKAADEQKQARIGALVIAAANGDMAMLMLHLKSDPPDEVKQSDALRMAAFNGQKETCEALLDFGCEPDGPTGTGGPLRSACQWGFSEIAAMLIERGATPNPKGANRLPPLFLAARRGDANTVRILLEAGAKVNEIAEPPAPVFRGGFAIAAPDHVAPPRAPRRQLIGNERVRGGTALVQAVQFGYADIIRLLVSHGADPNLASRPTESPISIAKRLGYKDIERDLRTAVVKK